MRREERERGEPVERGIERKKEREKGEREKDRVREKKDEGCWQKKKKKRRRWTARREGRWGLSGEGTSNNL